MVELASFFDLLSKYDYADSLALGAKPSTSHGLGLAPGVKPVKKTIRNPAVRASGQLALRKTATLEKGICKPESLDS